MGLIFLVTLAHVTLCDCDLAASLDLSIQHVALHCVIKIISCNGDCYWNISVQI